MALMKYKEIVAVAKEKVREALAPMRAREMQKKAELEVCKIESDIMEKEQAIQELASQYPINFDRLLDSIDDLELTQRRKAKFEEIIKELFAE